eukprot:6489570-Amphidinium_carterae.6
MRSSGEARRQPKGVGLPTDLRCMAFSNAVTICCAPGQSGTQAVSAAWKAKMWLLLRGCGCTCRKASSTSDILGAYSTSPINHCCVDRWPSLEALDLRRKLVHVTSWKYSFATSASDKCGVSVISCEVEGRWIAQLCPGNVQLNVKQLNRLFNNGFSLNSIDGSSQDNEVGHSHHGKARRVGCQQATLLSLSDSCSNHAVCGDASLCVDVQVSVRELLEVHGQPDAVDNIARNLSQIVVEVGHLMCINECHIWSRKAHLWEIGDAKPPMVLCPPCKWLHFHDTWAGQDMRERGYRYIKNVHNQSSLAWPMLRNSGMVTSRVVNSKDWLLMSVLGAVCRAAPGQRRPVEQLCSWRAPPRQRLPLDNCVCSVSACGYRPQLVNRTISPSR